MSRKNIEEMNIFEKLAEIRESVKILQRNKKGFNYRYVTEDEILNKITLGLKTYHIDYYPSTVRGSLSCQSLDYQKIKVINKSTGETMGEPIHEILLHGDMVYRWVNLDNPADTYDVDWMFVGSQADASQAFGSALTYSNRYFLLKFFKSSTSDDDPDAWKAKQEENKKEQDALAAKDIIEEIDKFLKAIKTSDNEQTIVETIKSMVKVGGKPSVNYAAITDPIIAANLLKKLKDNFDKKDN